MEISVGITYIIFEGHLYIIDVSQSVDLDHPLALKFLKDCDHISDFFFKKHGVTVMTIRELFVFIVDPTISDENVDSYLEEAQRKVIEGGEISVEDEIADSVFMKSYIPKTLDAVKNPEADVEKIRSGQDTGDMLYQKITGHTDALPKVDEQQVKVDVGKGKKEKEKKKKVKRKKTKVKVGVKKKKIWVQKTRIRKKRAQEESERRNERG